MKNFNKVPRRFFHSFFKDSERSDMVEAPKEKIANIK
jgi:hypothetical protein